MDLTALFVDVNDFYLKLGPDYERCLIAYARQFKKPSLKVELKLYARRMMIA